MEKNILLAILVVVGAMPTGLAFPLPEGYQTSNLEIPSGPPDGFDGSYLRFLPVISIATVLASATLILGCLCCRKGRVKGFENVQNGRTRDGYDNHGASTEFTMFPPAASTTANLGSMGDIQFEPLPDIRPRGRTTSQKRPRPATFSNVVNRGLSVQDWFEAPHSNFPRHQLQYVKEVGSGWFGQVVEGEAQGIVGSQRKTKVVVKILREDATPTDQMYFLHEIKPFRDLSHPNILQLLGRCLESDPFLIIFEYCAFKDLKTYLVQHRTEAESLIQGNLLLQMACNVASGLHHMHSNGFLHTDLAARNCLVGADLQVKIGDYGNSIEKFKEDYYCAGDMAVPIRWCSPETLRCTESTIETKEVTQEANIWSFGVVVWEILEFGKLPYGERTDEDVLQKVIIEHTDILPQSHTPCDHKDRIYQVLKLCWLFEPKLRPNMEKVHAMLSYLYASKDSIQPSADFETRWNLLQPSKSNGRTDLYSGRSVPTVVNSGTEIKFESHFPGVNTSGREWESSSPSPHPSLSLDGDSSWIGAGPGISPSLQNLRGSLDDLISDGVDGHDNRRGPLEHGTSLSETDLNAPSTAGNSSGNRSRSASQGTLGSAINKTDIIEHDQASPRKIQVEFDAWIQSQADKGPEEFSIAKQISAAIGDLDEALANERTSSSVESSLKSSPEREILLAGKKSQPAVDCKLAALHVAKSDSEILNSTEAEKPSPGRKRAGSLDDESSQLWREIMENTSLDGPGQVMQLVREKSQSVQDFLKLTVIDSDNSDSDSAPNGTADSPLATTTAPISISDDAAIHSEAKGALMSNIEHLILGIGDSGIVRKEEDTSPSLTEGPEFAGMGESEPHLHSTIVDSFATEVAGVTIASGITNAVLAEMLIPTDTNIEHANLLGNVCPMAKQNLEHAQFAPLKTGGGESTLAQVDGSDCYNLSPQSAANRNLPESVAHEATSLTLGAGELYDPADPIPEATNDDNDVTSVANTDGPPFSFRLVVNNLEESTASERLSDDSGGDEVADLETLAGRFRRNASSQLTSTPTDSDLYYSVDSSGVSNSIFYSVKDNANCASDITEASPPNDASVFDLNAKRVLFESADDLDFTDQSLHKHYTCNSDMSSVPVVNCCDVSYYNNNLLKHAPSAQCDTVNKVACIDILNYNNCISSSKLHTDITVMHDANTDQGGEINVHNCGYNELQNFQLGSVQHVSADNVAGAMSSPFENINHEPVNDIINCVHMPDVETGEDCMVCTKHPIVEADTNDMEIESTRTDLPESPEYLTYNTHQQVGDAFNGSHSFNDFETGYEDCAAQVKHFIADDAFSVSEIHLDEEDIYKNQQHITLPSDNKEVGPEGIITDKLESMDLVDYFKFDTVGDQCAGNSNSNLNGLGADVSETVSKETAAVGSRVSDAETVKEDLHELEVKTLREGNANVDHQQLSESIVRLCGVTDEESGEIIGIGESYLSNIRSDSPERMEENYLLVRSKSPTNEATSTDTIVQVILNGDSKIATQDDTEALEVDLERQADVEVDLAIQKNPEETTTIGCTCVDIVESIESDPVILPNLNDFYGENRNDDPIFQSVSESEKLEGNENSDISKLMESELNKDDSETIQIDIEREAVDEKLDLGILKEGATIDKVCDDVVDYFKSDKSHNSSDLLCEFRDRGNMFEIVSELEIIENNKEKSLVQQLMSTEMNDEDSSSGESYGGAETILIDHIPISDPIIPFVAENSDEEGLDDIEESPSMDKSDSDESMEEFPQFKSFLFEFPSVTDYDQRTEGLQEQDLDFLVPLESIPEQDEIIFELEQHQQDEYNQLIVDELLKDIVDHAVASLEKQNLDDLADDAFLSEQHCDPKHGGASGEDSQESESGSSGLSTLYEIEDIEEALADIADSERKISILGDQLSISTMNGFADDKLQNSEDLLTETFNLEFKSSELQLILEDENDKEVGPILCRPTEDTSEEETISSLAGAFQTSFNKIARRLSEVENELVSCSDESDAQQIKINMAHSLPQHDEQLEDCEPGQYFGNLLGNAAEEMSCPTLEEIIAQKDKNSVNTNTCSKELITNHKSLQMDFVTMEDLDAPKSEAASVTVIKSTNHQSETDDMIIVDTQTNDVLMLESERPQTHLAFVKNYSPAPLNDSSISSDNSEDDPLSEEVGGEMPSTEEATNKAAVDFNSTFTLLNLSPELQPNSCLKSSEGYKVDAQQIVNEEVKFEVKVPGLMEIDPLLMQFPQSASTTSKFEDLHDIKKDEIAIPANDRLSAVELNGDIAANSVDYPQSEGMDRLNELVMSLEAISRDRQQLALVGEKNGGEYSSSTSPNLEYKINTSPRLDVAHNFTSFKIQHKRHESPNSETEMVGSQLTIGDGFISEPKIPTKEKGTNENDEDLSGDLNLMDISQELLKVFQAEENMRNKISNDERLLSSEFELDVSTANADSSPSALMLGPSRSFLAITGCNQTSELPSPDEMGKQIKVNGVKDEDDDDEHSRNDSETPDCCYTPDWESESDTSNSSPSSSSTSGEFECSKDSHSKFSVNDSASYMKNIPELEETVKNIEPDNAEEGDCDGNDMKDNEENREVFRISTWDKGAVPHRSALRSPEKILDSKRSVSFKEEKPPLIYEYPREEPEWEEPPRQLWGSFTPSIDFNDYTDWTYMEEEIPEDIVEVEDYEDNSAIVNRSPMMRLQGQAMYQISNVEDDDFGEDFSRSDGADEGNFDQDGNVEFFEGAGFTFRELLEQYGQNPFYSPEQDGEDFWAASLPSANFYVGSSDDPFEVEAGGSAENKEGSGETSSHYRQMPYWMVAPGGELEYHGMGNFRYDSNQNGEEVVASNEQQPNDLDLVAWDEGRRNSEEDDMGIENMNSTVRYFDPLAGVNMFVGDKDEDFEAVNKAKEGLQGINFTATDSHNVNNHGEGSYQQTDDKIRLDLENSVPLVVAEEHNHALNKMRANGNDCPIVDDKKVDESSMYQTQSHKVSVNNAINTKNYASTIIENSPTDMLPATGDSATGSNLRRLSGVEVQQNHSSLGNIQQQELLI